MSRNRAPCYKSNVSELIVADFPPPRMNAPPSHLLAAPIPDETFARETLAYVDAHDGIQNADYAFVAYKETHRLTGTWCVRIASSHTAGAVFHPNAIRLQARAVAEEHRRSFVWASPFSPRLGDPRRIEFRVYVSDGRPATIEIFVRLRKFDYTPDEVRIVTFPWPEA